MGLLKGLGNGGCPTWHLELCLQVGLDFCLGEVWESHLVGIKGRDDIGVVSFGVAEDEESVVGDAGRLHQAEEVGLELLGNCINQFISTQQAVDFLVLGTRGKSSPDQQLHFFLPCVW